MKKQEKHPHHTSKDQHDSHKDQHTPKKPTPGLSYLPHILAVIIFLIVTIIFFKPLILGNEVLNQGDIVHYKGVSKELQDYREKTGKEALWTGSMFTGMPAFQVSTLYNGNLLRFIDSIMKLFLPHPSGLLFLAFISFYILLLVLRISPYLSIGGAIAFGLSSYDLIILSAGHNSKMSAMAYMPMVLAGVILLMRKNYLWGTILFAISMGLEIRSNHLQISFYLGLMIAAYIIIEGIYFIKEGRIKELFKPIGLMILAGILAIATNASLLWCTMGYVNQTIRGKSDLTTNTQSSGGLDKDYAFDWSYGKMETMTLLIPNFYGGSSDLPQDKLVKTKAVEAIQQNAHNQQEFYQYLQSVSFLYWGPVQFTSGPVYLGAVICFLFLFGMFVVKDRIKWWLLAVSVLGIMMAWGKNLMWFNDIFFYYFPGYNKFRTVEMALVIPQLAFVVLAIKAVSDMVQNKVTKEEMMRALKITGGVVGGLCLVFAVMGGSFFDFIRPKEMGLPDWLLSAIKSDRQSVMQADSWRSFIFVALTAGAVFLFATNRIKSTIFIATIVLLSSLDLLLVGERYLNSDNFVDKDKYEQNFAETQADAQILNDTSLDYRVFDYSTGDPFDDSHTSYYHKSVGGYSAVKLRRYQELIENHLSKNNANVLDMLNTKYVVGRGQGDNPVVQRNPGACGNAWFVDSVKVVENADEEINRIGPMYHLQAIGNTALIVNNKKVTSAETGNHDHVKVDSVDVDPAEYNILPGKTDTLGSGISMGRDRKPHLGIVTKAQGAKDNLFTVTLNYTFYPLKNAIVDKRFASYLNGFLPQRDTTHSIKLMSYEANHLVYNSNSARDGFVVFSEIYYHDGWKCTVDGKDADYIRVDYVLRGMKLSAGKHTIDFKFEPVSFYGGEKISLATSGLLLLLLIGLGLKDVVMKKDVAA